MTTPDASAREPTAPAFAAERVEEALRALDAIRTAFEARGAEIIALHAELAASEAKLAEAEKGLAAAKAEPAGLMAAVRALYDACGEEWSEESEALGDLPAALNQAIADVIHFATQDGIAPDEEGRS